MREEKKPNNLIYSIAIFCIFSSILYWILFFRSIWNYDLSLLSHGFLGSSTILDRSQDFRFIELYGDLSYTRGDFWVAKTSYTRSQNQKNTERITEKLRILSVKKNDQETKSNTSNSGITLSISRIESDMINRNDYISSASGQYSDEVLFEKFDGENIDW